MVRSPRRDEMNVKRGLWTPEEDAKMPACVCKHGTGNWTALSRKAGLKRCGKSCRLRWNNHLKPDINHDSFTPQEEEFIVKLHATLGSRSAVLKLGSVASCLFLWPFFSFISLRSPGIQIKLRWTLIAQQLPGRTDNDVKNYWNTKLRKKLFDMGIDPVTHKPFSQILADYGNIGGLSKSGTRIGSLGRDLKSAFGSKPEHDPQNLERNQDCYLSSNNISTIANIDNDHSLDLLDQIQAIKLVREASRCTNYDNISPQFLVEGSTSSPSPSSSSSSTCSTAAQENSAMGFSWRDFLIDDELLPNDDQNDDKDTMEFSSKEFINQTQNETTLAQVQDNINGTQGGIPQSNYGNEAALSSHTSFVDAILEQENDMFMDFPNLLNEPLFF